MPWGSREVRPGGGLPRNEALRADYRKLIAIRRAHRALSRGSYAGLSSDGDLLVFLRREGPDAVVVAVNRGASPATATFLAPQEWGQRSVTDALDGSAVQRQGASVQVAVPPRSARILTP
jgi:alpha-amylase